MTIRVAFAGAAGRMGRALLKLAAESGDLTIAAAVEAAGRPQLGEDAGSLIGRAPLGVKLTAAGAPLAADVVVDFSAPAATLALIEQLSQTPLPLVCGTTGLEAAHKAALAKLAEAAPVVWAPNFSTGVNLLFDLVFRAAAVMGPQTEVEVVEAHHKHKKDAPSGTAVRLVEQVARALNLDAKRDAVHGREGITGERPLRQIGVHALRGGEVVGEHTVFLFGEGERLELTHRAASRDALAAGALRAVRWVVGRRPGLYDMMDVLGMKG
ncbi:MAG: 4-hydroxy-tetrahydrodipicolinate reductase [Myxococcales bacterium]|nr:MAG: 4-hydroxy-tetrahydrodipicolinate reductase [Myxococcales bacterium]